MLPEQYAAGFTADLEVADSLDQRHLAQLDGMIGASSFDCRERMRRTLLRVPASSFPSKWAANVGKALDGLIKNVRREGNPRLILDADLKVILPNGFELPVHPDEIDPDEPSCTDLKSRNGLAAIRAGFAEDSSRFQRHLQGFAALANGVVPRDGLIVRNVFVDRSGKDPSPHVEQEPFNMTVVDEATAFLDDALYAVEHGEEAFKDKPRYFCKAACEHYKDCRGGEVDTALITDVDIARRVDTYQQAREARDQGQALMDGLRADTPSLEGVTGRTDSTRIVSTWVNASQKRPYWKVETEPLT